MSSTLGRCAVRACAVALLAAGAAHAGAPAEAGTAQALRERYAALAEADSPPFGIPLHLRSVQQDGRLQGDIYSQLDHRYDVVREALRRPGRWCEIMILHPNVQGCRASDGDAGHVEVRVGRAGHAVDFAFRIAAASDDYLDVRLEAPSGPAGTSDYRIRVEAVPLDGGRTLMHLRYSHGFGAQAKLAMNAYFGTVGRDKVGFSVVGRDASGRPELVRDLRGGLERNAMRYYLAIRSYLEVMALPAAQRLEQGLTKFIAYTERWPRQLREAPGYAERKRAEIAGMAAAR